MTVRSIKEEGAWGLVGTPCSPAEDHPTKHHGLADLEDVGPAAEAAGTPGALSQSAAAPRQRLGLQPVY